MSREQSIYELAVSMPANQDLDNDTNQHFVDFLSAKLQSYSNYTAVWSDSLFQQFYKDSLEKKDIVTAAKEAKNYINYFISDFIKNAAPCLNYIKTTGVRCTYKECQIILENIFSIEKALESIASLSQFGELSIAGEGVYKSIYKVFQDIYLSDFYINLQKRLCSIEINRIDEKYLHRHLPLVAVNIPKLKSSLETFEKAYELALSNDAAVLASSVRMKIVPILNELISYVQQSPEDLSIAEKIAAEIDDISEKCRKSAIKKKADNSQMQLEVDLELLKQISETL